VGWVWPCRRWTVHRGFTTGVLDRSEQAGRAHDTQLNCRVEAIEDYTAHHNEDPTPFIWTGTAKQIITKVRRRRVALETLRQSRAIEIEMSPQ
jgi:hypothetical protein